MRTFLAAILVLLATATVATADVRPSGRCSESADAAIDQLQLDRARISAIKIDIQYAGLNARRVSGINFWLSSASCKGSLVIVLSESCRYLDSYTRGDCTIDDFKR